MPIHIYQQKKYDKRLSTLAIAVYEMNKSVFNERLLRKRGETSLKDQIKTTNYIPNRKELNNKYGYNISKTQLLPYSSALIQIPIHLTMFVSLRTMSSKYQLWNEGGFQLFNNQYFNFLNLSSIDSTLILPFTIGITMGLLQYMLFHKNRQRSIGINEKGLKFLNITTPLIITYLSMNWSIGFNLYILSNLSSYIVQQNLLNSNIFRNIVGLNNYSLLQSDIKRLQIIYKCMNLAMKENQKKRIDHIHDMDDIKTSWNIIPHFQSSWIKILSDINNFKSLNITQNELNLIINDIKNVDKVEQIGIDHDDDDDKQEYLLQFTDKDEINKTRKSINIKKNRFDDDYDYDNDDYNQDDEYQKVKVQKVKKK